ncbi:hypothetical protein [Streptomyces sp. NPDC001135]
MKPLVDGFSTKKSRLEFGATLRLVLSDHVDGAVISIDEDRQRSCDIVETGGVRGAKTA